jgi:dihydropteroate synthase
MPSPPRRVLFVTGKLAEPALRRTLTQMNPPFEWDLAVLKITVAALMTTPWIARFLKVPEDTELILLPGLVEGNTALLQDQFGVATEKGPKDLREIPIYFGQAAQARDYGEYDIEILAEINNAPKRPRGEVMREAEHYRSSGADIIDIGCTPGVAFPGLRDLVRDLRFLGLRVSIDSFDPAEITTAVEAGAEMVLSVNGSNVGVVEQIRGSGARVVAIPDFGAGLDTLEPTLAALERARLKYLIDPIIEPIGFGFMASLERYAHVHRRYPDVPQLMGIGNITELTSADSTGINALLIAICQELGVKAVLTTEVISWARGAVKEIDVARRLMYHAVSQKTLPKGVDDRLVTIKDPRVLAWTETELRELQARVKDSNFRIFADRETITVFNNTLFIRGANIQEIFDQLGVDEPTHAFYLGKELARASLAVTLGKTYRQEGQLSWGYLTPPDDPKREHVKLTMKSGQAGRRSSGQKPVSGKPASGKRG